MKVSCLITKIHALIFLFVILITFPPQTAFATSTLSTVEYSTPTYNGRPNEITLGEDNNIWFTEIFGNQIGKIDDNGAVNEYPVPGELFNITRGINSLWFLQRGNLGKISYEGQITIYPLSDIDLRPSGITLGSDGNMWFTIYSENKIAKITNSGEITEYIVSDNPDIPLGLGDIVKGSDGNVWFVEFNNIGKITPNGNITRYSLPVNSGAPNSLVLGPDNNIWFTQRSINKIGRITPNGSITQYTVTSINRDLGDLTVGKDGNIWFVENDGIKLGKITMSGSVTHYNVITTSSGIINITTGADGDIWYTDTLADKVFRIELGNEVTPTPFPTTLTDYKQTDPKWATARLDNSNHCGTLYGFGCAVTSVADVFYSYGKTVLGNNVSLDPGGLNNWLANHNGYQACAIIWSSAASAVRLGAPTIHFRNGGSWTVGKQAIDTALAFGHLPIIGINTIINGKASTHFLVVSEKLPDVNGKPDYKLIDPAQYPFNTNNPGNSGKSLSQIYGGFDKVFETVIYKPDSTMQNTLTIRAHSPVQLLITDPEGNRTGYDTDSQNIIEDIPESAYGVEPGIAPVDGSAPASPETKYFQQINPTEGEYNIQLIGTGDGSYTLDFAKTDEEGNNSLQVIKGFAQKGVTENYVIEYVPDASQTPTAVREVTFDTLKSDLKGLYNQKQITSKVIYQTLLLQAELAEKATNINRQPLGNKLAVIPLKTFQLELNRQRGKQVTEEAYQILTKDITYLINILQGNAGSPTPTPQPGGS